MSKTTRIACGTDEFSRGTTLCNPCIPLFLSLSLSFLQKKKISKKIDKNFNRDQSIFQWICKRNEFLRGRNRKRSSMCTGYETIDVSQYRLRYLRLIQRIKCTCGEETVDWRRRPAISCPEMFVSIMKIQVIGLVSKKWTDNIAVAVFFFSLLLLLSSQENLRSRRSWFLLVNRIAPREFCCSLIIGDYRQARKGIFFVEGRDFLW